MNARLRSIDPLDAAWVVLFASYLAWVLVR